MTDEQLRREADLFLVRSEELLEETREHQRYVERTLDETMRGIRDAMSRLRNELRRASYR